MEHEGSQIITKKIGFIGGGNMATAIFNGITTKGLVNPSQVSVAGPHLENIMHFRNKGAYVTTSNGCVVDSCDIIFISVKPQILQKVVDQITKESKVKFDDKIFVSILAGTSIKKIEEAFNYPIKLIRVMPNTAVAVGEGCSVFTVNERTDILGANIVQTLLKVTGLCLEVPESQIDAIAAVSGSGPAFMYLVMEALADGGVKMGIPRSNAIKLAAQTMLGAAKLVQTSGKHSAQLKDEVCSAGGTTITGMHALEKGGVRSAFIDAVEAATKKAIEMGQSSPSSISKKKCSCCSDE